MLKTKAKLVFGASSIADRAFPFAKDWKHLISADASLQNTLPTDMEPDRGSV